MALLLFDIDGTMVNGGESYNVSMQKAIKQHYRKDIKVELFKFHGYTDRLVLKALLNENRIPYSSECLDACLKTFGELYPDCPSDISMIPGVGDTIPCLLKKHILGLVTGNVEEMARKKLRKFAINGSSLDDYFLFGGFGSDLHNTRADLVRLAVKRSKKFNGSTLSRNPKFVIDDTPRGARAAREAGVIPIGVTTGRYTGHDLMEARAEYIIANVRELPDLLERIPISGPA